jgi:acetolactate synthase I/II/III large subunit
MNGAELLFKTAMEAGIEVCFTNAGTTEMPLVAAFDRVDKMKPVLGLFEGVCTGAADGYGRMMQKPALVLLHLGPGLGNGIANLHNARRAGTPIVAIIGDHATWHRSADAPLTMDIETLAGTVSGWRRTVKNAQTLSQDMADAIAAAMQGQICSLVVPHDCQWTILSDQKVGKPPFLPASADHARIEEAARLLKTAKKPLLLLGGKALRRKGLIEACRTRSATACDLMSVTFPPYADRGAGLPVIPKIPYFPEQAVASLSTYDTVILAGAQEPVAFFGYENGPSRLLNPDSRRLQIAAEGEDEAEALEILADMLSAPSAEAALRDQGAPFARPESPTGVLTAEKACTIVAARQPEGAIIVEEAITSAFSYYPQAANVHPHSFMTITGGAIGWGIPCATGAAIACPDRPVIALQADGSAMYTVQGLWTQAREGLNVTTLICNNRSYFILQVEMMRAGLTASPKSSSLTDLSNPAIDWVQASRGMGVPAVSVSTAESLDRELRKALAETGPHLIDMIL